MDDKRLFELLHNTYERQRFYINNETPSITQLQKSWPCLLHGKVLYWNYRRLMCQDLNQLEAGINIKIERMLEFARTKKLVKKIPTDINDQHIELLRVLAKQFKERFEMIFKILPDRGHAEEVESLSPCIIFAQDENKYIVVIEKIPINEGSGSFIGALKEFYACFFVFNMKYPSKANSTLEVLQRYFMKTHPDSGTKSTTYTKSKSAVIRFVQSFSDYVTSSTSNK
ncbi:uncharacterized protein LOC116167002 [Photinus pyralis]|uniref:uncharacterized protein LOC116167002 n=1 Tax=Photinus pyralis TaxID=7054 RepID=UPI0012676A94|nr:uncharacterized protein LOC116160668 isoform X2 [Photinus pyralis]XP_031338096.1 uncharacterized protein LOC116167002 [Photinus pyralis]